MTNGCKFTNVSEPVVVINIDTLILYEDFFAEDKDLLFRLVNEFIIATSEDKNIIESFVKAGDKNGLDSYLMNLTIPFSHFANIFFMTKYHKKVMPKRLNDLAKSLFPEANVNLF